MKKFLAAALAGAMLLTAMPVLTHADNTDWAWEDAINLFSVDDEIMPMAIPESSIALTPTQIEDAKTAIKTAIDTESADIDISALNITFVPIENPNGSMSVPSSAVEPLSSVFRNFFDDNAEYFYASIAGSYGPGVVMRNGEYVLVALNGILEYDAEKKARAAAAKKKADEIISEMYASGVREDSDFDKALWLHDYLANTIAYDSKGRVEDTYAEAGRTLDTALLDGVTVCEGYAGAYKYLLEKVGMECINVYSITAGHKWSAVNVDDQWYYADVTQDDPYPDKLGHISHQAFLVDTQGLEQFDAEFGGTHADPFLTTTEVSIDTDFNHTAYADAPWRNADTLIAFDGDYRYYAEFNDSDQSNCYSAICKSDSNFTSKEEFEISNGLWFYSERGFANGYFGGIGILNGYLYYNTATTIERLNLSDMDSPAKVIKTYTPDSEYSSVLYGMKLNGSAIDYITADMTFDGTYIIFNNYQPDSIQLTYTVTFKNSNGDTVAETDVISGNPVEIPDYTEFGHVTEGWYKDADLTDKWDFETDTVTDDITLYVKTEEAQINRNKLYQLRLSGGMITGGVEATITNLDTSVQKAPTYAVAIYKDGALDTIRTNNSGIFDFTGDNAVVYDWDAKYTVKAFIWNDNMQPLMAAQRIPISRPAGEVESNVDMDSPLAVVSSVDNSGDTTTISVYTDNDNKEFTVNSDANSYTKSVINKLGAGDVFIYESNSDGEITDAMLIYDMPELNNDVQTYSEYVNSIFAAADDYSEDGNLFDAALAPDAPTSLNYKNYGNTFRHTYFTLAPVVSSASVFVEIAPLNWLDGKFVTFTNNYIIYDYDNSPHIYNYDWNTASISRRVEQGSRGTVYRSFVPSSLYEDVFRGRYIDWADHYGIGGDYDANAALRHTNICFALLKVYDGDVTEIYSIVPPVD